MFVTRSRSWGCVGRAPVASHVPLLGGFHFMILLRALPLVQQKIRHHYFPALVTWSVMENNLSYFLLPYCLTSACPPCPSALARPSWPVRRVPSALARPPWPVCPGPSAMARLACQATSRPSLSSPPSHPPHSRQPAVYVKGHFIVLFIVFLMSGSKL